MKKVKMVIVLMLSMVAINGYATCRNDILPTKSNSDLLVNTDGTITDNKSNLIWMKCSVGLVGENCETGTAKQLNWRDALAEALAANAGPGTNGFTDWRLPSVVELATLVEGACFSPAINVTRFPQTAPVYWSSTPSMVSASSAWIVDFDNGTDSTASKSTAYAVRLVRGGL